MPSNLTCQTIRCTAPALCRIDCTDYPNGGYVGWSCADHAFDPKWDEAPRDYAVTVSGPHR